MSRLLCITLSLSMLLSACGSSGASVPRQTSTPEQDLESRVVTYKTLSQPGWTDEGCDGLLFSALTAVGRDDPIDIEQAQGTSGQWFRNPEHNCYPVSAPSDISRDMILGLMVYSVHFHRLDLLQDLWTYGEAHKWIMGRGDDRAVLTPESIGRLARAIEYLGGEHHAETSIPAVPSTSADYEGHLALLGIYLDGKMAGGVTSLDLLDLHILAKEMPDNPLAQALLHKYTDGDQSIATGLLLEIWPSDRLPTTADWCEPWRIQRADGDSSLQPCPAQISIHSGGDFLLVAAIVMGNI